MGRGGSQSARLPDVSSQNIKKMFVKTKVNKRIFCCVLIWLCKEAHFLNIIGSNPNTVHWIDIFSHQFVVEVVMLKKTENKRKRSRGRPIFKTTFFRL